MLVDLKRLGKESLVYGLSAVGARLLSFVLTPFYTHFLSPAEVGIISNVFACLAFLNIVYQYGMDQAFLRYGAPTKGLQRQEVFSSALWPLAATTIVLTGIIVLFPRMIASFFQFGDRPGLALYCAPILALDCLAIVPFAELRLSHRPWATVAARLAGIVVNVGLNFLLLWRFRMGIRGVFLASIAGSATSALLLVPVYAANLRLTIRRDMLEPMLRFALPFMPSGLASMVVQVADRPILKYLTHDNSLVGLYSTNYKLGIFMMLVVSMFDMAWRPFFLERENKQGARELFGRVLTYFTLAGSATVLGLSLFIGDLVRIRVMGHPIIAPAFWPGLPVVPIILAGYLFNGMYINFISQVTLAKRSDLLMWATGIGAAVNVGANFLLIPHYGMIGAAWATLLAYAAMAACLYFLGQSVYPVPYEFGRIARIALSIGIVLGGLYAVRVFSGTISPGAWTAARTGALLAFPLILWTLGFFYPEELRALGLARRA